MITPTDYKRSIENKIITEKILADCLLSLTWRWARTLKMDHFHKLQILYRIIKPIYVREGPRYDYKVNDEIIGYDEAYEVDGRIFYNPIDRKKRNKPTLRTLKTIYEINYYDHLIYYRVKDLLSVKFVDEVIALIETKKFKYVTDQ